MIHGKRVIVVLPAYNAEKTLRQTVEEIPTGIVDEAILVDDASADHTVRLANELGLQTVVHFSDESLSVSRALRPYHRLRSAQDGDRISHRLRRVVSGSDSTY